jgi:hypothetical protein
MMTGSPGVTWQQFIVLDGGLTFARMDLGAGGYGGSRGGQAGPGYGSTAGYGGGGAAGGGGGYGVTAICSLKTHATGNNVSVITTAGVSLLF